MSDTVFNVHDAKSNLSALLARVEAGEVITIARHGRPVARLAAIEAPRPTPRFGVLEGKLNSDQMDLGPTEDDWSEGPVFPG
jgi:prevent-host-death family protein